MNHYPITLSGPSITGPAGPIPPELQGLAPESLADLSASLDPCPDEFQGLGYWPAAFVPAAFDPETQRLSDQMDETSDPTRKVVVVTPLVVNLTPAEIEARRNVVELAAARATLADLDAVLPRSVEDIYAVLTASQQAALPQVMRDRISAKATARETVRRLS